MRKCSKRPGAENVWLNRGKTRNKEKEKNKEDECFLSSPSWEGIEIRGSCIFNESSESKAELKSVLSAAPCALTKSIWWFFLSQSVRWTYPIHKNRWGDQIRWASFFPLRQTASLQRGSTGAASEAGWFWHVWLTCHFASSKSDIPVKVRPPPCVLEMGVSRLLWHHLIQSRRDNRWIWLEVNFYFNLFWIA